MTAIAMVAAAMLHDRGSAPRRRSSPDNF